jgi:hypothetical protein
MSNPTEANWPTKCGSCGEIIPEGEDIFFTDEGKLCGDCAEDGEYICLCGNFKKPDYGECWTCAKDRQGGS